MLKSITIPCMTRDLDSFDRLLSWWSDPRMAPLRHGDRLHPITLVVVLNRASEEYLEAFRAVFDRHIALHNVFSECMVFQVGLEGDRDLYVRGSDEAKGSFGNKAGPNFLFFETMRYLHPIGGHTFQSEIDCFPTGPGWLSDLCALVDERRFAWVIGSVYTGEYPVSREIQYHLNGNAVYKAGDQDFIRFINEVWEPRVLEFVSIDPNLAYDCWWAVETSRASSVLRNRSWEITSAFGQFVCMSQFLINTLHQDTALSDVVRAIDSAEITGIRPLFVHGHAATSLVSDFINSDEDDFLAFSVARHAVERDNFCQISVDDISVLGADDEFQSLVSMITLPAAEGKNVPFLNAAFVIESLPSRFSILSLPDSVFLGNWHVRSKADHIWAGNGGSVLTLSFSEPQTEVEILINGAYPPIDVRPIVICRAFGAESVEVTPQSRKLFRVILRDQSPFTKVSLLFDVSNAARIDGDERDLGFVLFGIEVLVPDLTIRPDP